MSPMAGHGGLVSAQLSVLAAMLCQTCRPFVLADPDYDAWWDGMSANLAATEGGRERIGTLESVLPET